MEQQGVPCMRWRAKTLFQRLTVGFTLQYELYTTILTMLQLGGIPLG